MNSNHQCPTWCTVDHQKSYATTPSGRELHIEVHMSALIRREDDAMADVRVIDHGLGESAMIMLGSKTLTLVRARKVAAILCDTTELRSIANDIYLALRVARGECLPEGHPARGLRGTISGASITDAAR